MSFDYSERSSEPISQKEVLSTDLTEIANDFYKIRNFDIRHQESRSKNWQKRELKNHESSSPILRVCIQDQDWSGVLSEVKDYGCSRKDQAFLVDWALDKFEKGDLESLSGLYKQISFLKQKYLPWNKSFRERQVAKSEDEIDIQWMIRDNIKIFEMSAYDTGIASRRYSDLESANKSVIKKIVKNKLTDKLASSKVSKATVEAVNNELLNLQSSELSAEIRKKVRKDITDVFIQIKNFDTGFPELTSNTLKGLTAFEWADRVTEIKEKIVANVQKQISSGKNIDESLLVLLAIDPHLALSEASVLGKRELIIREISSQTPDLILSLRQNEDISEEEVGFAVGAIASSSPDFLLTHYQELDYSGAHLKQSLAVAVSKADLFNVIELAKEDLIISEIVEDIQVKEVLTQKILQELSGLPDKDILNFHLLFGDSPAISFTNSEYREFVDASLNRLVVEVREKIRTMGDIDSPEFIESLGEIHDPDSSGTLYRDCIYPLLGGLPDPLVSLLLTSSFIDLDQGAGAKYEVSANMLYICAVNKDIYDYRKSQQIQLFLVREIIDHWGIGLESISLLSSLGISNASEAEKEAILQYLISFIRNIDSNMESVYNPPDYGGPEDQDHEDYVYSTLANISFLLSDLKSDELKQAYLDLACKDLDFTEKLCYLDGDEDSIFKVFNIEDAKLIISAQKTVKDRLTALRIFSKEDNLQETEKIFQVYQEEIPVLKGFKSFRQYLDCRKIYYKFDEDEEGIKNITSLVEILDEIDIKMLSVNLYLDNSTFSRFAGHIIIAKQLERNGFTKREAFAWASCASNLYENPLALYSKNIDRNSFVRAEKWISENKTTLFQVITDTPGVNWLEGAPKLLETLIGDSESDIMNSMRVVNGALEIDEENQERLAHLFSLKDLKQGRLSRKIILGSLMKLAKDKDSKELANILISKVSGSKDDPGRLRTIFRLSDIVDPSASIREGKNLKEIKSELLQKASKKIIDLLGFKEDVEGVDLNVELIFGTGVLGAYSQLKERYSEHDYFRSAETLRGIYRSVVMGTFSSERRSSEISIDQLSGLAKTQVESWFASVSAESMEDYPYNYFDMKLSSQSIVRDLRSHLSPHMQISKSRQMREINRKNPSKYEAGIMKKKNQINQTLKEIENIDLSKFDPVDLASKCLETERLLKEFGEDQPASDMRQIIKVLNRKIDVSKKSIFTVQESDSFIDLLNSGVYPQETCQSWRDGSYNQCLVSTVADANKRLINVYDEYHNICARALIKALNVQREKIAEETKEMVSEGEPFFAIVLEKIYASRSVKASNNLILIQAVKKAKACGMPLVMSESTLLSGSDLNLIKSLGGKIEKSHIAITKSNAHGESEYSDIFGGEIVSGSENIPSGAEVVIISFADDE